MGDLFNDGFIPEGMNLPITRHFIDMVSNTTHGTDSGGPPIEQLARNVTSALSNVSTHLAVALGALEQGLVEIRSRLDDAGVP